MRVRNDLLSSAGYQEIGVLKHIPAVVVTSYALDGEDSKALDAGCDAYFSKPVSPRELLAKVREYLD